MRAPPERRLQAGLRRIRRQARVTRKDRLEALAERDLPIEKRGNFVRQRVGLRCKRAA
jgi:hypothetical protein